MAVPCLTPLLRTAFYSNRKAIENNSSAPSLEQLRDEFLLTPAEAPEGSQLLSEIYSLLEITLIKSTALEAVDIAGHEFAKAGPPERPNILNHKSAVSDFRQLMVLFVILQSKALINLDNERDLQKAEYTVESMMNAEGVPEETVMLMDTLRQHIARRYDFMVSAFPSPS